MKRARDIIAGVVVGIVLAVALAQLQAGDQREGWLLLIIVGLALALFVSITRLPEYTPPANAPRRATRIQWGKTQPPTQTSEYIEEMR